MKTEEIKRRIRQTLDSHPRATALTVNRDWLDQLIADAPATPSDDSGEVKTATRRRKRPAKKPTEDETP